MQRTNFGWLFGGLLLLLLVEPVVQTGGAEVAAVLEGAFISLLLELLYFSYVTLTTLGYGDVTPVSPLARTLAYLEAATGQLFVAVLIASLISRLAWPSREVATPDASG